MPLSDAFDSMRFAFDCVRILEEMWGDVGSQEGQRRAQILWGRAPNPVERLANATAPWFLVLDYPNCIVKIFAGAARSSHVRGIINGYHQQGLALRPPPVNSFALAAAEECLAVANLSAAQKAKTQINIGHSFGGMIATIITAAEHVNPAVYGVPYCVTFGTPKVGMQEFVDRIQPIRLVRYMAQGDPVPRIYPALEDSRFAAAMMAPLALARGLEYIQSHGGCLLSHNNPPVADVLPPLQSDSFNAEIYAWWNAVSGDVTHPHHLRWYRRLFERYLQSEPAAGNPQMPAGNIGEEPRRRPTLGELQAQLEAIQGQFIDSPDPVPVVGAPRPVPWWTYRKEGLHYAVYCSSNLVCKFSRRSRAKRMVRGGNLLVNNWERAALGTELQLEQAIQAYIEENDFSD